MPWAPVKDGGSVTRFHGGTLQVKQCNANGTVNAATSWVDVGYFRGAELRDETPNEPIKDGAGDTVATLLGERTVTLRIVGLQRNKTAMNFVDTARDAVHWLYLKASKTGAYTVSNTAKTLEVIAPLAELTPTLNVDFSTNSEIEYMFTFNAASTDVSVTLTSMAGSVSVVCPTSQVIASGTNPYYNIAETGS